MSTAHQPATMIEALQRVITDLASAMVTPDADVQFLSQLQGVVVGRMRQGAGGMGGQQQPGQGGPPPPQGPPPGMGGPGGPPTGPPGGDGGMGGGMGGPPPGSAGPPPGMLQGRPTPNGVTPLAQAPSPDELRRLLAGKAGA